MKDVIIFSLWNDTNDSGAGHEIREILTNDWTSHYQFAVGSYKGQQELSIVIPDTIHGVNQLNKVFALAEKWNQESILWIDNQGQAFLIYVNGKTPFTHIGHFHPVKASIAKKQDAWTSINGVFYIAGEPLFD